MAFIAGLSQSVNVHIVPVVIVKSFQRLCIVLSHPNQARNDMIAKESKRKI